MVLRNINIIKKFLIKLKNSASRETLCQLKDYGIYECSSKDRPTIVGLYTLEEYHKSIEDYEGRELVQELKKFIEILTLPNCYTLFLTTSKTLDSRQFLNKLDRKLQMKLVELQLDRANARLQSEIMELMQTKRKVIQGIIPLSLNALIAIVCPTNIQEAVFYVRTLRDLRHVAKSLVNISLKPVNDLALANAILNFRYED